MMEREKTGMSPAFGQIPIKNEHTQEIELPSYYFDENATGISKRFYAACHVIQGLLSNPDIDRFGTHNGDKFDVVDRTYRIVDKLIERENK